MTTALNERESAVLDLLAQDQHISVAAIADRLGVSAVTARSYLNALSDKGHAVRVHGGATAAYHAQILKRQQTMQEQKRRIASTAAELISDGMAVMVEAGTTTALVARNLIGLRDVRLVTNNTLAFTYARAYPQVQITLVGGEFRATTESVVGPTAREQLSRFHADVAILGTDGFSADGGLTTNLVEGAEIVQLMAGRADRVFVVADSSKAGRAGFVHTLMITAVNGLITDDGISDGERQAIEDLGVEVRVV